MPSYFLVDARRLRELVNTDHRLLAMLVLALEAANESNVQVLMLGDIYRSPGEDRRVGGSGVHAASVPYRAADIESNPDEVTIAALPAMTQAQMDQIAARINATWIYDHKRPQMQCAISRPHGTGPHIHLQVHPNTMLVTP